MRISIASLTPAPISKGRSNQTTRVVTLFLAALGVSLFSAPSAQAGEGRCTAGRGAKLDGGSCCAALGVSDGACACDDSRASTAGTVTCSHATIKEGATAKVPRTVSPALSSLKKPAPPRLVQVVARDLNPARVQMCLAAGEVSTHGGAGSLHGAHVPNYAPLTCETVSYEGASGGMEYFMRCLIDSDLNANNAVDVQVNLRVYNSGSSYWNSCAFDFPIVASEEDPADAAQAIANRIDTECVSIAAGSFDLGNGTAVVDIWSTDSPIICVGDVPAFESACDQLSSVLIAN